MYLKITQSVAIFRTHSYVTSLLVYYLLGTLTYFRISPFILGKNLPQHLPRCQSSGTRVCRNGREGLRVRPERHSALCKFCQVSLCIRPRSADQLAYIDQFEFIDMTSNCSFLRIKMIREIYKTE